MKFKTVLLAVAVMLFASASFAQFNVTVYTEVSLTTTCNGPDPIPMGEGTAYAFWAGNNQRVPEGGGFGEAPRSHWELNGESGDYLGIPGTFYTDPGFGIPTTVLVPNTYYFVVEYPTVNPQIRWTSGPRTLAPGTNQDWIITDWTCETLTIPCNQPERYDIPVQNWHTFAPYYQCLHLCPGIVTTVCLHGLKADNVPHVTLIPGCELAPICYEPNCPPAAPVATPWFYVPDPTGGPFGTWCMTIVSSLEGCVCLCVDFIESAELGSFDAVAGDNSVSLSWNTLSESNLSSFRVLRDNEVIGSVSAQNSVSGASYTFVDESAVNGTTYTYSLASVNMDGTVEDWGVTVNATPSMNAAVITEYALHQNYPNPFNPTTNIVFDVVSDNFVTLTVYNAMGQEVATLVNGTQGAGRHTVAFDAANLTSGLYFYTVKIGNEFTATKKMMLVK